MKTLNLLHFSLISCALAGCKAASTSGCLSTTSNELKISDKSDAVQGGYIHFGDKSCSATFDVVGVSAEHIRLKAYSARHCRFENGLSQDQVSVSLYFGDSNSARSGYIKNIPVNERFVDRATQAMQEVKKLNAPRAEALFLSALRIPVQFDPWFGNAYAEFIEDQSKSSLICNDFEQIPSIPDPQDRMTDSCWSALDLGTFDLVIRKNAIPPKQFFYLTEKLNDKAQRLQNLLSSDAQLKSAFYESRKSIDSIMTLLRSHQASRLVTLLNFDLCQPNVRNDELCKNQTKLIEIVAKNFTEPDREGRERNLFDWMSSSSDFRTVQLPLSDLLAGKRVIADVSVKNFSELDAYTSALTSDVSSHLKDKSALHIINMRSFVVEQSRGASAAQLSPSYLVGSNFVAKADGNAANYRFGLFGLSQVFSDPKQVQLTPTGFTQNDTPVHGISLFGTLRVAFPRESEVVKFQPTDSGSLITLHGIIPLMVLNTVNDVGTSGGSAILALPEIGYDDEPLSPQVAQPGNAEGTKSVSVRVNDGSFTSTGPSCF